MNTHYLDHHSGQIAYDDSGSGPLVICAPGLGDLRAEYRFLIPQLVSAGFRVVSVDVRGHGESSTAWSDFSVAGIGSDIAALIRHLQAGPAVIVGTSMAAGAAVWAAAEAPEQVAGLVLVGPFVSGETSTFNKLLYSTLFARPWGPTIWQYYYASLYPTRKPADFAQYRAALSANLQEPGRLEALVQMILASKSASEERLPQVTTPTMVLMGSKDPDFKDPAAEARRVAQALRGGYKMIEGAGHYPHAEMPEVAGPLVLSFLQTLQTTQERAYAA